MNPIIGEGEEYKKVVDSGESMTQIRGNAGDWYKGDNTEYEPIIKREEKVKEIRDVQEANKAICERIEYVTDVNDLETVEITKDRFESKGWFKSRLERIQGYVNIENTAAYVTGDKPAKREAYRTDKLSNKPEIISIDGTMIKTELLKQCFRIVSKYATKGNIEKTVFAKKRNDDAIIAYIPYQNGYAVFAIAPFIDNGDNTEKPEKPEKDINNGEKINFSVTFSGRMATIKAECHGEVAETRWTKKAIMSWVMLDRERLHDEQYKLAKQLAGKEYGIVGTGNRLWLQPAQEQEWIRWQRKQPEEAILTITFGKVTGNNGDRLIRGHATVNDHEGKRLFHVSEIYNAVTPGQGLERLRLLKLAKKEMEKTMKCEMCNRGEVFFKNIKKVQEQMRKEQFELFYDYGDVFDEAWKNVYLVTWYPVELNEIGQCIKCYSPEQVWRNSTVETDIPTDENVMLKDQLDYENEDEETTLDRVIHKEDRLNAYEDIEFIASLDRHAVNEHLGTGSNDCKNESFLWAAANTTRQELAEAANNV